MEEEEEVEVQVDEWEGEEAGKHVFCKFGLIYRDFSASLLELVTQILIVFVFAIITFVQCTRSLDHFKHYTI